MNGVMILQHGLGSELQHGTLGKGLSNDLLIELSLTILFQEKGVLSCQAQQGEDPALLFELCLPSFYFMTLAVPHLVI